MGATDTMEVFFERLNEGDVAAAVAMMDERTEMRIHVGDNARTLRGVEQGQEWRTVVKQGSTIFQAIQQFVASGAGTPAWSLFVALATQETDTYPNNSTNLSDAGRKVARADYQYDSYGNVIREDDYDASNGQLAELRYTRYWYSQNTDPAHWIVDKLWTINSYEASGKLVAAKSYDYDNNYSPTNPPQEWSPATPSACRVPRWSVN